MAAAIALLSFVTLQRLAEVAFSRANERRLRRLGAREFGAKHYPVIVGVHAAWLAGLWWLAWDRPVNPAFLAIFVALQAGRLWTLAALGRRWTTRVFVVPGERLVAGGPYRYMRHPNYAIVIGEIACLPLVFGLWWFAAGFTLLNAAVLRLRITCEEAALDEAGRGPATRNTAATAGERKQSGAGIARGRQ